MEAAANARSIDEILKDIDITVDEDYIAKVKENLGETLATRYIDYTRIKEMAQQAKEHRLILNIRKVFKGICQGREDSRTERRFQV